MPESLPLESWIADQARRSAEALARAISATHLLRHREAFGQTVIPAPGSVLASPAFADWDPEPDYFFHWLRDSAIVMRSVAELMEDAGDAETQQRWRRHFEDFVRFSLKLCDLDGAALAGNPLRPTTRHGYRQHLRPDSELRGLSGDRLLGEPRFNPDGTPDLLRWSRPQYDGPALRALACLRFLAAGAPASPEVERLLEIDLDFTARHADHLCIGPWEEAGEQAHHYYVAVVQLGALVHGRPRAGKAATVWQAAEKRLRDGLERHWLPSLGVYTAIRDRTSETAEDVIDAAQLLAVLDAELPDGPHSLSDPRVAATQSALEALFARELPINHDLPPEHAPALGRSRGDRYFGGGAWYPTTLAAAALCYRRADVARGDAFMAKLRALTPANGALSEQVDRETGAQTSARDLTWSYAAFVSTARLRTRAVRA